MVIAMVSMGVVEMAIHEIVDMIAVRYGFVTAARPMHMPRLMARTSVIRRASVRIHV